jgi:hypothetical protein
MVEVTLNWNHVTQVLGPNGNITYPGQLLPAMIGALGFLRILWLLFRRWQFPEADSSEERQGADQKIGVSRVDPFDTPQEGLGLLSSPSNYPEDRKVVIGQEQKTSTVRRRPLMMRYLVAYLPWMSQFDFWKNSKGHPSLQSSHEEDGKNDHDSPLTVEGKDVGLHFETRKI